MLRVGLTGGIATGKSLAAGFLKEQGARIVDADVIARQEVAPGKEGLRRIVDRFGPEVLTAGGVLDRAALGRIVFESADCLHQLNRMLHPLILDQMEAQLKAIEQEDPGAIAVADVPLLVECGLQDRFDRIIVVAADCELQLRRLIQRDGLGRQEAEARLGAQMNISKKRKHADYLIENTGSIADLDERVRSVYALLKKDFAAG